MCVCARETVSTRQYPPTSHATKSIRSEGSARCILRNEQSHVILIVYLVAKVTKMILKKWQQVSGPWGKPLNHIQPLDVR